MQNQVDYSIQRLRLGLGSIHACWGILGAVLAFLLLQPALRLTPFELKWILIYLLPIGGGCAIWDAVARESALRTIQSALERHREETAGQADYEQAFAAIMNLPRAELFRGMRFWSIAPVLITTVVYFQTDTLSIDSIIVFTLSGLAAGMYSYTFIFGQIKSVLRPYRELVASGIPDPAARTAQIQLVPFRVKLIYVVTSIALISTFFSLTMGQSLGFERAGELNSIAQAKLLDASSAEAARLIAGEEGELAPSTLSVELGPATLLIVDRETGLVVRGDANSLQAGELRAILDEGTANGDSTIFNTRNHFSWQVQPDGRHLLIAVSPKTDLALSTNASLPFLALILGAAIFMAIAAAQSLGGDINRSLRTLGTETERIASGDLRRASTFESEDDLGLLTRHFEKMTLALREIIANVSSSADRVEQSSESIVVASHQVSSTSTQQGTDIREVTFAMENIDTLVQGMHDFAISLNAAVETSTTSVGDLLETGEGLSQSGVLLAENVTSTSEAYKMMFHSIEDVSSTTDRLGQAASETASGVQQITSALSEINRNASETSRLSEAVIDSAERGQNKVKETIQGMGSIRENTGAIADLVHDFRQKTEQIGMIVNVIDDVADETNLLALNAAVIAAQSGEQGRAFSVVAEEINELADRVLSSTQEISSLIRSVQDSASNAVGAIEQGAKSVETGVALSEEAGSSLEEITAAARDSGVRMHEVVAAVREQSSAAEHLYQLMTDVLEAVKLIESATDEQSRSTEAVTECNHSVSVATDQLRRATEEQTRSAEEIGANIHQVREVSVGIARTLDEESTTVETAAVLLCQVNESTLSNEESTDQMKDTARALLEEAAALREGIERFKI